LVLTAFPDSCLSRVCCLVSTLTQPGCSVITRLGKSSNLLVHPRHRWTSCTRSGQTAPNTCSLTLYRLPTRIFVGIPSQDLVEALHSHIKPHVAQSEPSAILDEGSAWPNFAIHATASVLPHNAPTLKRKTSTSVVLTSLRHRHRLLSNRVTIT